MQFSIHLAPTDTGWITLEFSVAERCLTIVCSHLYDSPGELLRGLAELAKRPGRIHVECTDERKAVRLTLRRRGDTLEIAAQRTADGGVPAGPSFRGRPVNFRHAAPFAETAAAILAGYDRLLAEVGAADYQTSWRHPFPVDALRNLQATLTSE